MLKRIVLFLLLLSSLQLSGIAQTLLPDASGSPAGPIAKTLTTEAIRLARAQVIQPLDPEWLLVQRLSPETNVLLVVQGVPLHKCHFISADSAGLTVKGCSPSGPIERIARAEVREIVIPRKRLGGSRVLLGVLGSLGGMVAGYNLAYDRPRGDKGLYQGLYVGLPVDATIGAVAGVLIAGSTAHVVYRGPPK